MKLDDNLAFFMTEKISFFKYIHPNYITISGIISNLLIYFFLIMSKKNLKKKVFFIIIFRYLTDILDGNVARKYNKTSKLGGFLDTINDFMLFFIINFLYIKNKFLFYSLIIVAISYIIIFDLYYDHSKIKKKGINAFFVNNTIFIYTILILFIFYKYQYDF